MSVRAGPFARSLARTHCGWSSWAMKSSSNARASGIPGAASTDRQASKSSGS